MRTRNLVIIFFMTAVSIVSLVLILVQDQASIDIISPTEPSAVPTANSPVKASTAREGTKKTPPPDAAPDLKSIALDPNKPRPLPAIVPTMPSTPPPMPATVPEMPPEPPAMPNLVMPLDGSMPYDPSIYDPKTRSAVTKNAANSQPKESKPKLSATPKKKAANGKDQPKQP